MKEKIGKVFSIANDNAPVSGCTISKEVHSGKNYITYFSLAKNTDISAEIYLYHKLLIVANGMVEVYGDNGFSKKLEIGEHHYIHRHAYRNEDIARSGIYRNIN